MSPAPRLLPPPKPHAVIQHDLAEDFSVYEPAGFILRWYAITLDITFAAPLDLVVHLPFERYLERLHAFGHVTEYYLLTGLLTAIPVLLYFVVPTSIWGQTLGKRIVGLRVVSRGNDPKPSALQVVLRETVGRLASLATLGTGFLMAAAEPDKRALHDWMTRTDVVSYRVKSSARPRGLIRNAPSTYKPGR